MSLRLHRRGFTAVLFSFSAFIAFGTLHGESPLDSAPRPGYEEVELFPAIARGEVTATVYVRNAEQLQLAIENRTERELAVRMPDAFAAVPVHAQFQPGGFQQGGLQGFNQGNNAQNQGVGAPGGNFNFGNNGQNNGLNNAGIFNVPPAKIVRAKLPCVCLEIGKDDPHLRIDYEIRPLNDVLADGRVARLVQLLAQGANRRVVQLAVWHRANNASWEQLAALKVERLRQPDQRQYSSAEIKSAQKLLAEVDRFVRESQEQSSPTGELSAR